MARLVDRNGLALSIAPVSRRFQDPANDLEVNYLDVLCSVESGAHWRSTSLTLFNWELAAFAKWLRAFAEGRESKPYDPHSEIFAFWGRRKGEQMTLKTRLSGVRHELVLSREDLQRFADQLQAELQKFPIATTDDV